MGGGSGVIMEFVFVFGGGGEFCFIKVVCYGDCGVDFGEKVEFFNNSVYMNY